MIPPEFDWRRSRHLLYTPDAVLEYVRTTKPGAVDAALHADTRSVVEVRQRSSLPRLDDVGNVPVASVAAFALAVTKLTGAQAALEKRFLATTIPRICFGPLPTRCSS